MECRAYAKLNLSLDILRRREDGYHDLQMLMQSIDLSDCLTITPGRGETATSLGFLPADERNLARMAVRAFQKATGSPLEVDIAIQKHIPVCAGMAGGSSDAAAVLRAMNEMAQTGLSPAELARIGEGVGSDVPYCVIGGTALVEGRGERVTPLPSLPPCHVVLCKPDFPISTPQLFGRVDVKKILRRPDTEGLMQALEQGDLPGLARRMYNVFEDVLLPRHRLEIDSIKAQLIDCGALGAAMSGSGPTVFGLFDQPERACAAFERLRSVCRDTFLAHPV